MERRNSLHQRRDSVPTGVPVLTNNVDLDYFRGYSTIHVHEEMLGDMIRTNAYKYALLKNYPDLHKKTVMDVGAGTGILSVFAVQAGAKKVYAIEACEMAEQAKQVVKENDMSDRIHVIQKLAEEVVLPQKVDALISEWMGYCLLYESMLPSVLRARDKFLRPGGLMFPCKATLYLAPMYDGEYISRLEFWKDMKETYKVNMDSMMPAAHACLSADADIRIVPPEAVQAHAVEVCSLDLMTASPNDVEDVESNFCFKCFGRTTITGFVTWFTVEFPGGSTLSTSPYQPETHWAQTTFHLRRSFRVEQDTEIKGVFEMHPHPLNHRCMEIDLEFIVDDKEKHEQCFSLHNTCPGRQLQEECSLIPSPGSPMQS
ncbi:protein arginine N-methyltransferase 6-like isoform X2 [Littorina saxatilis]